MTSTSPTRPERVTLEISGMSCGHCVRAVSDALTKLPGLSVESVEIGSARVALDPEVASTDVVVDAIRLAGYEVRRTNGVPVTGAPRSLPLA
jgi:copper chaperone CopZ